MEREIDRNGEGDGRHEQLLTAIGSLGGRRKGRGRGTQRSEGSATISEFHLSQRGGGGGGEEEEGGAPLVSVGELLSGLGTEQGFGYLRKRLRAVEHKTRPLPTPLHKHQAEKIQRAVAYRESSKQVSKWIPIVKRNREADHLSFPLQDEQPPPPSLTTRAEGFKPMTEMEREIAAVLEGSENVERDEEELTQAERKALLTMGLEEANERRTELQKMRALMSYYEQKCRRVRRIKSKRFHRALRKKRDALSRRKGEEEEEGKEEAIEKAERIRANERMTLKHSNMSKWARQQLARGHRDPNTQQALTDHHHIRHELKQKTVQEKESDSDESLYSESVPLGDEEGDTPTQHATPSGPRGPDPWLTTIGSHKPSLSSEPVLLLDTPQVAGQGKRRSNRKMETSGKKIREGGREGGKERKERETMEDLRELPTDFEPEDVNQGGEEEEEEGGGMEGMMEEGEGESSSGGMRSEPTTRRPERLQRSSSTSSKHIDPTSYMTTEEGGNGKGRMSLGAASDHLLNVQEAFAGDDVVGEFLREKEEEEEKGKPKVLDLSLPGWGTWGGIGTRPPKKKAHETKPAKPQKPRRDKGLSHVIISEERDKKASKHQVTSLPWPYTSKEQFDKTHCTPIGRHWNTEATFQKIIAPKVSTVSGSIIEPIKLTEDVRDFMKRTEKKGRRMEGGEEGKGKRKRTEGGRKRERKKAEAGETRGLMTKRRKPMEHN